MIRKTNGPEYQLFWLRKWRNIDLGIVSIGNLSQMYDADHRLWKTRIQCLNRPNSGQWTLSWMEMGASKWGSRLPSLNAEVNFWKVVIWQLKRPHSGIKSFILRTIG
jgi:hypothetical protein